jgi:hypothetical protein
VAAAVFATPSSAKSALAGGPEQNVQRGAGAVEGKRLNRLSFQVI